jgi:hypothetical protein
MVRSAVVERIAKVVYPPGQGPTVVDIDKESLLARLLFFDEVIVDSVILGELPFLVKMFGVDGFENLLDQGVLKLRYGATSVITDFQRDGRRYLPLLQFDEGLATLAEFDKQVVKNLKSLVGVTGLSNSRREVLGEMVSKKLLQQSTSYGNALLKQVKFDLLHNAELIKTLLLRQVNELDVNLLKVTVEDLGGIQRFETNLKTLLGVNAEREHDLLANAIKATANINQRLADMAECQAISNFEDSEAPILFGKIHGIVSQLNPSIIEKPFLRVITFTDIPQMLTTKKIDVDELLKIRASSECKDFKNWMASTDTIDDKKLKNLINGFKSKAASFISSKPGKTVRLGVNTGLGLIPTVGSMAALFEGVVDTFLLDKLLPSSGVLTFLNKSIPSVFKSA